MLVDDDVSRLRVGEAIPTFETQTLAGEVIRSEDLKGRPTLITFYRYASCPVCAATLAPYLVRHWELDQRGVRLLAFFHSPAERMATYFEPDKVPFELAVDPQRKVYEAFGVTPSVMGMLHPGGLAAVPSMFKYLRTHNPLASDGTNAIMPADFIVDAEGVVADVHYGRHLGSGWSIDQAIARIESLGLGTSVAPAGAGVPVAP